MEYMIYDDFLPEDLFKQVRDAIINPNFPMYYQTTTVTDKERQDEISFAHTLYRDYGPTSSNFDILKLLIGQSDIIDCKSILRSKINCYPRTEKLVEHDLHTDYDFQHKGFLYYLNTCDGYTILNNGEDTVDSVENRLLIFDPSIPHASTSCTDEKCRWNIIMNYL